MRNKKGFTLIELLAVIVILAIIAVITVPKIADMISSSRQGGAEDSFYGTLKAAELGYTKALQSNTNLKGSTCTIEDSKINCTNGVKIDVSGKTPESGTLVIDSAGSTIAKALTLNGYKCYGDLSTSNPCVKADVDVASETLIKKVTTTGDGLYKDSYEDGRYIFKGKSPNNYLTFNDENAGWRIVAIEADGTLKIIRENSIKQTLYDEANYRKSELNTFCTISGAGCGVFGRVSEMFLTPDKKYKGTVIEDSSLNLYLNSEYYNSILPSSKYIIQNHIFNIGAVEYLADYNLDSIEKNIKDEKSYIWNGNIGLANVSDVLLASKNSLCTSATIGHSTGGLKCDDSYLFQRTNKRYWLINNFAYSIGDRSPSVWVLSDQSDFGMIDNNNATDIYDVRPVLYLKANLQLEGSGTSSDPYKILNS